MIGRSNDDKKQPCDRSNRRVYVRKMRAYYDKKTRRHIMGRWVVQRFQQNETGTSHFSNFEIEK